MRWAALAVAAIVLTGCETTAEESAKLEKAARAHRAVHERASTLSAAALAHPSTKVIVTATAVTHSSEGTAAAITLHNVSSTSLRDIPIEITARDGNGAAVYRNTSAGLSPALVSVPLLAAHASFTGVDDQVSASSTPTRVSARLGEGERAPGSIPALNVTGHLTEASANGGELEGEVLNASSIEQHELVVYVVASRGGRIVAAGRAVLAQLAGHGSSRFEVFLIGDPRGAQLQLSAPATTLG